MTAPEETDIKIIDLLQQLEKAAPNPPRFSDLRQYANHDRSRLVPLLGAAAVVALAVGGFVAISVARDEAPASDTVSSPLQTSSTESTTAQSAAPATVPSGRSHQLSWRQLGSPGFSLDGYTYVGTLRDGRAVLWNGTEATESVAQPRDVGLAFFDPTSNAWSRSSPFSNEQFWANDAEIVGNSVIVHQYMSDGSRDRFARYDIEGDEWTMSAELPADTVTLDWAANDATIAAWTYPLDDPNTRTLWRWSGDSWEQGAAAPFSQREREGTAHQDARLAVYGGLSQTASAATVAFPATDGNTTSLSLNTTAPYASLDGGIYDVTTNTWTAIPRSPLIGVADPTVLFDGDTVVVSGGQAAVAVSGLLNQLARYRLGEGWQLSASDPAWRGGGVAVVDGVLLANNNGGYLVSESPFGSWRVLPGKDIQISWQPIPLGDNRYLQAYRELEMVRFALVDGDIPTDAPATPWPTSPDTGYASAIIPTPAGPIIIDGTTFNPWQLSVDS